jgi:hypothetical protein
MYLDCEDVPMTITTSDEEMENRRHEYDLCVDVKGNYMSMDYDNAEDRDADYEYALTAIDKYMDTYEF